MVGGVNGSHPMDARVPGSPDPRTPIVQGRRQRECDLRHGTVPVERSLTLGVCLFEKSALDDLSGVGFSGVPKVQQDMRMRSRPHSPPTRVSRSRAESGWPIPGRLRYGCT